MNSWQLRPVPFTFQVGDFSIFSIALPLQVRSERLVDNAAPATTPQVPDSELAAGSEGFVVRAMPLAAPLQGIIRSGRYLCYVPQQYEHCYIDMSIGFERYQAKFSSKTRSTILRKIRKFADSCGGALKWESYKTPDEIDRFLALAVKLSKTTYQDRLLDAGLPDDPAFRAQAREQAARDEVRAYILFNGEVPVSYLYCPVEDGVLSYSYQGYDPAYMHLSVGTVLQWLAVEQLFAEAKFRYFDFTEGQSDHKRLFATDRRLCANVFMVRASLAHRCLLSSHMLMNRFSNWLGVTMERFGLKARIKRLLRFSR